MQAAIRTEALTKTYSSRWAGKRNVVDAVSLEVREGEIFGLLGPNGAGKTTMIKMLLGIIYPSGGSATIMGHDIFDVKTHYYLSYLPEKPYYYDHMTGAEILDFYARLFKMGGTEKRKRIDSLLRRVGLADDAGKPIGQYSKGMQQRIGLAQCLLNDPKILFLDEPTGGLDPIAHIAIRDLILELRNEGKTVFISSHELSDVERICDRVAIMDKGRVVQEGSIDHLLAGGRVELIAEKVPSEMQETLSDGKAIMSLADGRLILDVPDDGTINQYVDALRAKSAEIVSITPRRKRLDDLFVETIQSERKESVV